jgi:hypothetical protein
MNKNEFVCPKCLKKFEDDYGGDYPRGRTAEVYCPDCETPIAANVESDWWLKMDESNFTEIFLKKRDFDFGRVKTENINLNWVWNYLERFIDGNKGEVNIWNSPEAKQAYQIVKEMWDKELKENEDGSGKSTLNRASDTSQASTN